MERIALQASEREVLGKKVKKIRRDGLIPGHVFGKKITTEHVSVKQTDFLKVLRQAGETGLIDLKIGSEKIRPVLIRDLQYDPVSGNLLHIDFYQVNLSEKVKVPVPIVLVGDEPESVHMGETVTLQTLPEVEVEALPTDLVENIEVDISSLQNVDDAISVGELSVDREKITILAEPDEVVVKLAPAVTEEMKRLLEEQEAEAAAAQAEAAEGEAVAEVVEGGEAPEGGEVAEGEAVAGEEQSEDIEQPSGEQASEISGSEEKPRR